MRVARWDLSAVDLVDPRSGQHLATLLPLDKAKNAERIRRIVIPTGEDNPRRVSTSIAFSATPNRAFEDVTTQRPISPCCRSRSRRSALTYEAQRSTNPHLTPIANRPTNRLKRSRQSSRNRKN